MNGGGSMKLKGKKCLLAYFIKGSEGNGEDMISRPSDTMGIFYQNIIDKLGCDSLRINLEPPLAEEAGEKDNRSRRDKKGKKKGEEGQVYLPEAVSGESCRYRSVTDVEGVKDYDVLILGCPGTWDAMPMSVFYFLKDCDLSNKVLVPVCTSSDAENDYTAEDVLRDLCPDSVVKNPLQRLYETSELPDDVTLEKWLANYLG